MWHFPPHHNHISAHLDEQRQWVRVLSCVHNLYNKIPSFNSSFRTSFSHLRVRSTVLRSNHNNPNRVSMRIKWATWSPPCATASRLLASGTPNTCLLWRAFPGCTFTHRYAHCQWGWKARSALRNLLGAPASHSNLDNAGSASCSNILHTARVKESKSPRKSGKFLKIFSCVLHLFSLLLINILSFVTGFMRMFYLLAFLLKKKKGIYDEKYQLLNDHLLFALQTGLWAGQH